jgi:hypothetical protein|tara:strand:- start:1457 stop:1591 length:135 start_codon:yes stop_codon:yes gene_type:complete
MKTIFKILITITLTPLMIIILIGATTIGLYETLWNSKKGEIDVE